MNSELNGFCEELTKGFEHGTLHCLTHDENGPELVMFLMDAEFDPVRLTFGPEGDVTFHADGNKWLSFTPDQLRFIAGKVPEAVKIWDGKFNSDDDCWVH